MLIGKASEYRYSEITPQSVFLRRREFLAAMMASGSAFAAGTKLEGVVKSNYKVDDAVNSYKDATTYNNFYEFGTQKELPAIQARNFKTSPWTVSIEGDCAKPRKFSVEEIMKLAPLEERVYRFRCVEAWSMIVPWIGFSLSTLLKQVEPTAKAKFVAFETYYNRKEMPSSNYAGIPFPYVDGLRLDEAMHPLALLTFGMYGEMLPPQNGAPIRMIVPWKYGFKSIKSIAKIKLQSSMPPVTWNLAIPHEYGFYSNVNPRVDHPRWSQGSERRLGEFRKRPTLMFNGYDEVAGLYSGMDLKKFI
ncbi:MAG: protein-methionine-sulfoxide reductase catalytic subunit MsrP [Candidatus Solibacter usitatus]|nr:protein-methionine-sulfoxide reductase catalytic subunit MsrP [Candidatus Solibacter usitatus]